MAFLLALTLVFITLKLLGIIAWSWFVVLLPIVPIVLLLLLGYGFVILLIFGSFFSKSK